jgi:hypothetical protein
MAVMWPRRLPREVLEHPRRQAEVRVFKKLEADLGDNFTVFYSRPWFGLKPTGGEKDGECDFIVAHPTLGLLTLEVKGGEISYDAEDDLWTSRSQGITHKIKNPIVQAVSAKHRLVQLLSESRAWRPRFIRARHGIIFPSCLPPDHIIGAAGPRYLFCCRDEFQYLRDWIGHRMGGGDPDPRERPLGDDGVAALTELLARPFTLRVPLGQQLQEDEEELRTLTPQQFQILELIQDVPRAAAAGGAGTGKTVLACEDAVRFAAMGRRTLLVCHSQPLAAELRRRVSRLPSPPDVGTFHEICMSSARRAGLPFTVTETPAFFNEELPELFLKAVTEHPEVRWDSIVVDEGQDYLDLWWAALGSALAPGPQSRFHVFFDCNQRVYARGGRPPEEFQLTPIRLTRNLRNTRAIHDSAMRHYDGFEVLANHLDGVAVEFANVRTTDIPSWVNQKVAHLIDEERVPPGDIAVIASGKAAVSSFTRGGKIGGRRTVPAGNSDPDAVTADTIRRFKGLECGTAIVVATPDLSDERALGYVALSRPRTHLIIAGDPETVEWLRTGAERDRP